MSKVRSTIFADHFGSFREERAVFVQFNVLHVHWIVKAGPSRSGLELGVRGEEWLTTGDAIVHTSFVIIVESATKWSLGPLLPHYFVLFWSEFFFPIRLWLIS